MNALRLVILAGIMCVFSCSHGPSAALIESATLSMSYSVYLSSDCYSTINITKSDSIILIDKLGYWDRWKKGNNNQIPRKAFKLNENEIKKLKKLALQADLNQLKDKYGNFDGTKANEQAPVQIFTITLNEKTKYISLKNPQKDEPSVPFIAFFKYLLQLQTKYQKM